MVIYQLRIYLSLLLVLSCLSEQATHKIQVYSLLSQTDQYISCRKDTNNHIIIARMPPLIYLFAPHLLIQKSTSQDIVIPQQIPAQIAPEGLRTISCLIIKYLPQKIPTRS